MASWAFYLGNRANLGTVTMILNTEDANYPISNCHDEDRNTIGKPADADETIWRLDLGSAYSIEAWGAFNHTLGTQTATISLGYSATDNPADAWGDLEYAATYASPSADFVESFTGITKRYWWYRITSQDAVVNIGELMLFDCVRTMTRAPSLGLNRDTEFNVALARTRGGAVHTEQWGSEKRRWVLPFRMLASTDYGFLHDDIKNYTAIYRPLVFTDENYSAVTSTPAYLVYVDQPAFRSVLGPRSTYELTLELVEA